MNHQQIWRAIELFAREHNMSCSGLAKHCGLDSTSFNHSKRWARNGQPRWPSTRIIAQIVNATGATAKDFFKYIIYDTPEPKPDEQKR